MSSNDGYWFPAKRYGWGWGLPITWQGWAVFAGFLVLVIAGSIAIRPDQHPFGFILFVIAMSFLFSSICWLKGEPTRWRWGDD